MLVTLELLLSNLALRLSSSCTIVLSHVSVLYHSLVLYLVTCLAFCLSHTSSLTRTIHQCFGAAYNMVHMYSPRPGGIKVPLGIYCLMEKAAN